MFSNNQRNTYWILFHICIVFIFQKVSFTDCGKLALGDLSFGVLLQASSPVAQPHSSSPLWVRALLARGKKQSLCSRMSTWLLIMGCMWGWISVTLNIGKHWKISYDNSFLWIIWIQNWRWSLWNRWWTDIKILNCAAVLTLTKSLRPKTAWKRTDFAYSLKVLERL